jgi:2-C-methyl-D-erythritol 4-phosphate cytidylyltransferase
LAAVDLDTKVLAVVAGGATRQESVWNGLEALGAFTHVLVHDAVRPFVSEAMVLETLGAATLHGAATTGLPVTDSLFRVEHQADERQEGPLGSLETARAVAPLGRDGVWSVQTPQVFELELLREAHRHARIRGLDATDDGRLVLELGKRLELVPGRWWNIKVTQRADLHRAEMLFAMRERLLAAEEPS